MRIHKEGTSIILCSALISAGITVAAFLLLPEPTAWIVAIIVWGFTLFITSFFRSPNRVMRTDAGAVFSTADGKIVALEEVDENEYFQGKRIVVSVFMSIWNVHVNWFPVAGRVDYFRHHHGLFLVAWHPKSSEDNERTTTVVDMGGEKIMLPVESYPMPAWDITSNRIPNVDSSSSDRGSTYSCRWMPTSGSSSETKS